MADLRDALLALRYAGIRKLPDAGDDGDRRLQLALEREMARKPSRRRGWTRRRIKIGRFAVPPVAMLAVVATAAAATTVGVVTLSATNVFQDDPQGLNFNGNIETVLPSTVRQLATVNIPDYGQVAVWGATTKPGGVLLRAEAARRGLGRIPHLAGRPRRLVWRLRPRLFPDAAATDPAPDPAEAGRAA